MATNAFDPNNIQQSQQGTSAPQDNFMSQPVNVSGSAADTSATGSSSNGGNGGNPAPTSSGRFQNLNSYLRANQNFNAQGGGLAGQIGQNLTSQANDLQKNFAQAQNDYQTSLNNARQRYDSNFVDNTLKNASNYYNPSVGAQVNGYTYNYANPNDTTSQKGWYDANNNLAMANQASDLNTAYQNTQQPTISQFQNMLNATYKGPTSLDPSQTLQAQVNNFSGLANNVGSEQGRFNLLNQMYNNPNYSQGQQSLDNLFLQSSPTQLANLQNSRITANNITNSLGQASADASAQAINAAEEANQTKAQTQAALGNSISGFQNTEEQAVQDALNKQNSLYSTEQTNLGNNTLNNSDVSNFGLSSLLQGGNLPLYNLNLAKYLQAPNVTPTTQNVASADDYSRIAALGKLAGTSPLSEANSKIVDTYGDPTQAGTFAKASPYGFNTAGFENDLNSAAGNYQQQLSPIQQAIYQDNANLAPLNQGLDKEGNLLKGQLGPEFQGLSNNEIVAKYVNGEIPNINANNLPGLRSSGIEYDNQLLNDINSNTVTRNLQQAALQNLMANLGGNNFAKILPNS